VPPAAPPARRGRGSRGGCSPACSRSDAASPSAKPRSVLHDPADLLIELPVLAAHQAVGVERAFRVAGAERRERIDVRLEDGSMQLARLRDAPGRQAHLRRGGRQCVEVALHGLPLFLEGGEVPVVLCLEQLLRHLHAARSGGLRLPQREDAVRAGAADADKQHACQQEQLGSHPQFGKHHALRSARRGRQACNPFAGPGVRPGATRMERVTSCFSDVGQCPGRGAADCAGR
jgi:hypothetical protein